MLVVAQEVPKIGTRRAVECVCDCGGVKVVLIGNIRRGLTKSCGCLQKQKASEAHFQHGESSLVRHRNMTAEFRIWRGMKRRCSGEKDIRYAGRGISVCERWKKYENFLSDMGRRPSEKHSIDRINNDGNYEPANCRWATHEEQMRNRSNSKFATFYGVTKHIEEWSAISGVPGRAIRNRIRSGWGYKQSVWTPLKR